MALSRRIGERWDMAVKVVPAGPDVEDGVIG
jgi:hypothetical protein